MHTHWQRAITACNHVAPLPLSGMGKLFLILMLLGIAALIVIAALVIAL